MNRRVFLLSPASTSGRRAQFLFNDRADFDLARKIRRKRGATIGEVFSFLSGLYFRGKLTYASAFGTRARGVQPMLVITPDRGLIPPETRITLDDLRTFAKSPIDISNSAYTDPFRRNAEAIAANNCDIVLLGSIASGKYVDVLLPIFGERLLFPQEFVGRGDMSRGGLLLRCVDTATELTYVPVAGAVRRGTRPPKLAPR
jgi:hypothetical protein